MALPGSLTQHTRDLGKAGEEKAARYLVEKGYTLLERNYQIRQGELDIIARDPGGVLVFVEVKSAFGPSAGDPAAWVTREKQRQIGRVAAIYLAERHWTECDCRFDVVAVWSDQGEAPDIRHFENAFMLSY